MAAAPPIQVQLGEQGPAGYAPGQMVDLKGDGSIVKFIVECGTGRHKPDVRPVAFLHYRVKLEDGPEVFNTRDSGSPYMLILGEETNVVHGLEDMVVSMREGEQSYAFIEGMQHCWQGGGRVPPGACVILEVELLKWREFEDVSEEKDGSVLKLTVADGEGVAVQFYSKVTVNWKLTPLESKEVLEIKPDYSFIHGIHPIPCGLSRAIGTMKQGEKAFVRLLRPHACKPQHRSCTVKIPGGRALYDITLVAVENPPSCSTLKFAERIPLALQLKNEANGLVKEDRLEESIQVYKLAVTYLEDPTDSEDLDREMEALLVTLHLNIAAVAVKKADWQTVLNETDLALLFQKDNAKGLLRRGKAYLELGKEDQALEDLSRVIRIPDAPESADAKRALKQLKEKLKAREETEKVTFKDMFKRIDLAVNYTPTAAIEAELREKILNTCLYCKQGGHELVDCPDAKASKPPKAEREIEVQLMLRELEMQKELLQRRKKELQEQIDERQQMVSDMKEVSE